MTGSRRPRRRPGSAGHVLDPADEAHASRAVRSSVPRPATSTASRCGAATAARPARGTRSARAVGVPVPVAEELHHRPAPGSGSNFHSVGLDAVGERRCSRGRCSTERRSLALRADGDRVEVACAASSRGDANAAGPALVLGVVPGAEHVVQVEQLGTAQTDPALPQVQPGLDVGDHDAIREGGRRRTPGRRPALSRTAPWPAPGPGQRRTSVSARMLASSWSPASDTTVTSWPASTRLRIWKYWRRWPPWPPTSGVSLLYQSTDVTRANLPRQCDLERRTARRPAETA